MAGLLADSGLQVRELASELVINNPGEPDRGQVHVEYADGYVSWERVTWSCWGTLEGFRDVGEGLVSGEKILDTLRGRA
ncbi:MAG TPA: hypothetical protein VGM53_00535 [Streptosporangiaceae bacterium]|jgi:hypothetical protein